MSINSDKGGYMTINIKVNGVNKEVDVTEDTPLLWVIRDELKLTGTKFGCGMAMCGACTVHIDGSAQRSCTMPIAGVANREITTIEAVSSKPANAIKAAWNELDVPQCGYCQSGQIMSAVDLLTKNSTPTDSDIDASMAGNVCRCATYSRIRKAIHLAADKLKE